MNSIDQNLEVTVNSTRGTQQFSFPKQTKVEDVIRQAVTAFGFATGDDFQLVMESNTADPLQPERPLVSYHIADGAVLILTSIGSGV